MSEELKGYNIATNSIDTVYISTGMVPGFLSVLGGWHAAWETIIWEWDGKKRGKIRKMLYHHDEDEAINYHFRYCRTLTRLWLIGKNKPQTLTTNPH